MSRRIGIREVASKSGVAVSSVSRVISGHPNVSPEMKKRVFEAVRALGYEPNIQAQNLRRGSTRTVGLLVPDISNPLFSEFALGAEGALNEAGYAMLIANSHGLTEHDRIHVNLLRQRVDGLLLGVSDEASEDTISMLQALDRPFVLLDRDIPNLGGPSVRWDHEMGMKAIASHLIGLGHKRIAAIGGNPRIRPTLVAMDWLRKVCADYPDVELIACNGAFSAEHGERTTDALFDGDCPPTAIIACSPQILLGVFRAIRRRNLRIPDDLSLATIDRAPILEFFDPPIAAIERDWRQFGRVATELLLGLINDDPVERPPQPMKFNPSGSCAQPPTLRRR